jgi:hypothetical protein
LGALPISPALDDHEANNPAGLSNDGERIPRDEDGHEGKNDQDHGRGWPGGTHAFQLA